MKTLAVFTKNRFNPAYAAARLAAHPDVDYAQARYRLEPRFVPNGWLSVTIGAVSVRP